jgi:hypothetical protein
VRNHDRVVGPDEDAAAQVEGLLAPAGDQQMIRRQLAEGVSFEPDHQCDDFVLELQVALGRAVLHCSRTVLPQHDGDQVGEILDREGLR